MNAEVESLVNRLRKAGYIVEDGGKHYAALVNGERIVMSKTPSDPRSLANMRADLKRAGATLLLPAKVRGQAKPGSLQALVLEALVETNRDWSSFTAREMYERLGIDNDPATVHTALNQLHQRGIVGKARSGKQIHWSYVRPGQRELPDQERQRVESLVRRTAPIQPEALPPAATGTYADPFPLTVPDSPLTAPSFWILMAGALRMAADALEAPDNPWRTGT